MPRVVPALALLLGLLAGPVAGQSTDAPLTAVVGAMPSEVRLLQELTEDEQVVNCLGLEFVVGQLEGRRVVIAFTGVGKVNAAMTTTALLARFEPAEVVFTGIAGGVDPDLRPGDLVIGDRLAQYDAGAVTPTGFRPWAFRNPVDGQRNPLLIPADPVLVAIAQHAAGAAEFAPLPGDGRVPRRPRVVTGVIATGDAFVASEEHKRFLIDTFDAAVCEMEGAAVAQVCHQQGVPFVVLRSVSDNADEQAGRDIERFEAVAAENAAALTLGVLQKLHAGDDAARPALATP